MTTFYTKQKVDEITEEALLRPEVDPEDGDLLVWDATAGRAKPLGKNTFSTFAGPDSFTIDTTDAEGNPTQVTEHYGAVTVIRTYTYGPDGPLTEVTTVDGVEVNSVGYVYSGGDLTGAA